MADEMNAGNSKPVITAVLGSQWGDEGKGKFVHVLSENVDVCCRFNGGANAGHTIFLPEHPNISLKLHQVPCGIAVPHVQNFLGHGTVIHLGKLHKELESLSELIDNPLNRLWISNRAHLLFDIHIKADTASEDKRQQFTNSMIGTTKQGIGPAYATKAARIGLRVADLVNWETFIEKYKFLCETLQSQHNIEFDSQHELKSLAAYRELFVPRIVDGVSWLHEQCAQNKTILIEGANAPFLDLDLGTYPHVTSSTTTVGGIFTGLGLPPKSLSTVYGIVKAYTTRVGNGPFITELTDHIGQALQKVGQEFGATTGRARRCGWLDLVLVNFSVKVNDFTCLCLSKIDVLTGLDQLKICVAYKRRSTQTKLKYLEVPASTEEFEDIEPLYETFDGWKEDLSKCKRYEDLPSNARHYIEKVESFLECPIRYIGTGAQKNEYITKL